MDDLHQMPVQHPGAGGPPPRPNIVLPDRDGDHMTLDWAQYQDKWERSKDGTYYGLHFLYYATNILSRNHQYMNIFVPAAYLHDDGTVNEQGSCNGYTARTAPVILVNGCAGWMSSTPMEAIFDYIREGFVHISVGARSRDLGSAGKAPSACVDQKAAVRMLRLHDAVIPGDKEKIISCGGSGGGQMSSILGATGNMPDYFPHLYEIGAAGLERNADGSYTSTIRDDIFASQCYCPIADIDNADMAYAWQRFDDPNIEFEDFGTPGLQRLSLFQQEYQRDLAKAYGAYLNGLGLQNEDGAALNLTDDLRGGSYYEQILRNISDYEYTDQIGISIEHGISAAAYDHAALPAVRDLPDILKCHSRHIALRRLFETADPPGKREPCGFLIQFLYIVLIHTAYLRCAFNKSLLVIACDPHCIRDLLGDSVSSASGFSSDCNDDLIFHSTIPRFFV